MRRSLFLPFLAVLLASGCATWVPAPSPDPAPPTPVPAPPEPVPAPVPVPPDAETVPFASWAKVAVGMARADVIATMGSTPRSVTVDGAEVLVWAVAHPSAGKVSGQVTMDASGHVASKVLW